ncbi:MAG: hypothetical protein IH604_01530 [Burkholderiales bacterium]|nr:hypothetical protein [Burkholderiales bacterium]
MSQTKHQEEQGTEAAEPRVRKGWELFWRIIAGLILLVIAWVAWVAYQIMPRSVVTPMAYATKVRPIGIQTPNGVAAPSTPAPSVVPAAPPSAADAATIAPSRTAPVETREDSDKKEGLRLATEISLPRAEKLGTAATQETKPGGAPAAPAAVGAAGKARP